MLIEDDPDLCESWQEIFDLLGYEHCSFQRGLKAIGDRDAVENCNLAITDYYLPDINGVEVIKRLREARPGLKAIVLTGSREHSVVNSVKQLEECELLHKPLNIETLEAAVAKILDL